MKYVSSLLVFSILFNISVIETTRKKRALLLEKQTQKELNFDEKEWIQISTGTVSEQFIKDLCKTYGERSRSIEHALEKRKIEQVLEKQKNKPISAKEIKDVIEKLHSLYKMKGNPFIHPVREDDFKAVRSWPEETEHRILFLVKWFNYDSQHAQMRKKIDTLLLLFPYLDPLEKYDFVYDLIPELSYPINMFGPLVEDLSFKHE